MDELGYLEIANPAYCYFGVGDQQNLRPEVTAAPLTSSDLRGALNFHLLFSERLFLVAEDMLLNERLMALLLNEYRDCFELGLFVPLLREGYDDIRDCVSYLSAGDLYNRGGRVLWEQSLNQVAKLKLVRATFDPDSAYDHYTSVLRKYIGVPGLLRGFGVSLEPAAVENGIQAVAADAGRKNWRRSAVFNFSRTLEARGLTADAHRLRALSSVLYMGHFGGLLNQPVAFPDWYTSYVERLSSTDATDINYLLGAESLSGTVATLDRLLPHTRREDIAQLGFRDVLALRQTSEFHDYIRSLHSGGRGLVAATNVLSLLDGYLHRIDEFFAERVSGSAWTQRPRASRLALVRGSAAGATVLGLADVLTGGAYTPGSLPDMTLAGSALVLLILERVLDGAYNESARVCRQYWSEYCSADGTFSSQVTRLRQAQLPPETI